jgi:hypothetical protein
MSKPFAERSEAKSWLHYQRCWHQPLCCVCGSGTTRADDPWEVYSVSRSTGADWMHRSCLQKFEHWADTQCKPDGVIPSMGSDGIERHTLAVSSFKLEHTHKIGRARDKCTSDHDSDDEHDINDDMSFGI